MQGSSLQDWHWFLWRKRTPFPELDIYWTCKHALKEYFEQSLTHPLDGNYHLSKHDQSIFSKKETFEFCFLALWLLLNYAAVASITQQNLTIYFYVTKHSDFAFYWAFQRLALSFVGRKCKYHKVTNSCRSSPETIISICSVWRHSSG